MTFTPIAQMLNHLRLSCDVRCYYTGNNENSFSDWRVAYRSNTANKNETQPSWKRIAH